MNNVFSKVAMWVIIALVLFTVFKQFNGRRLDSGAKSIDYSDFIGEVKSGHIKNATIEDRRIIATNSEGKKLKPI